ncbi:MAG: NosD domain-containing protein [Candidatus Bathyarchaeia archaeon]
MKNWQMFMFLLIFSGFFLIALDNKLAAKSVKINLHHYTTQPLIIVPDNYTTIQAAIDDAPEEAIILVRNGTYNECLRITKPLKIYGSETASTVIKSPGGSNVVSIYASDVIFAGFQIEGKATEGFAGIYISQGQHNQILNNTIFGNRYGVIFWDSSNITLRNNNITNNRFNFEVWGLPLEHFLHDIDTSNLIEGKPIYYLVNQRNISVPVNAGYLAIVNSSDITIKDLNISNNSQGVLVAYSDSIIIQDVTSNNNLRGIHMVASNHSIITQSNFYDNDIGILLDLSSYNNVSENNFMNNRQGIMLSYSSLFDPRSVENCICKNKIIHNGDGIMLSNTLRNKFYRNEIINNTRYGVLASSSNYNVFCENVFLTNAKGICFQKSNGNLVYNNNFINNTSQTDIDYASLNDWNLSQYVGGNYWSDDTITDVDSDGINDKPYSIGNFNIDYHPLAGTFLNHSIIWQNEEYFIAAITNSTEHIFHFLPDERTVNFTFGDANHTFGFCRLTIPKRLLSDFWQDNFTILIDGELPSNISMWEDDESIYVYLTYSHPQSQVQLIPELSPRAFLALFIALSAIIFNLKKAAKC